jgi:hypothetical protein
MQEVFTKRSQHPAKLHLHSCPLIRIFCTNFRLSSLQSEWKFASSTKPQMHNRRIQFGFIQLRESQTRLDSKLSKRISFLILAQHTRRLMVRVTMLGLILNQQQKNCLKYSDRVGKVARVTLGTSGGKAFFTHKIFLPFQFPLFSVCL